jgi:hypothetical protein
MLALKPWPTAGSPTDDGLVVIVLHPCSRATVLVVPCSARTEDVEELDMAMPMALYRAQIEAVRRGFRHIYVAPGDEAPWNPEWGVLNS